MQATAGRARRPRFVGCDLMAATPAHAQPRRREVVVNGKRVKTVDVHAHCAVPEALALVNHEARAGRRCGRISTWPPRSRSGCAPWTSRASTSRRSASIPTGTRRTAISRGRSRKLQNEKLAEACAANPERFVAFATVALQHPELAAEQLEEGVKKYGLRGAGIGGSVNGEEISDPKFHPFWAKAEQLGVARLHPSRRAPARRPSSSSGFKGNGYLGNVIGNPLETTIALSHLIFEGTLDKFPGPEDLRGAWRRLPAVVRGTLRSRAARRARPLPRRHPRADQEEADRVSEADVLRHDGVHAGRRAPSRRRGRREPAARGHRLPVSVDEDRRGSHPRARRA